MKHENTLKNNILEGVVIGVLLTGLSYLLGVAFGWIDHVNWLEAFAVFTSYICTWLCVRERRWNYPFGALSTAAYAVVFWQMDLYASAALNAYLVPTLIYGWYRWRADSNKRPITRVTAKWIPVYVLMTALTYGVVLLIVGAFDAKLAAVDSVILVGSILAQFLLDNKKIETWAVWAVVNVLAIYTYFNADLTLAGFQYITFLANTVVAAIIWNRSKNAGQTVRTSGQGTQLESTATLGEGNVAGISTDPSSAVGR
jgi:nicotinamide mononucleotide transporter